MSTEEEVEHTQNVTSSLQNDLLGRVKWFNNKSGYGFITVTDDGDKSGNDIFVHHSGIMVNNEQYKYLVQGEYVEFNLEKTNNGNHEFQAINVRGIKGGKLMCETRRELLQVRNSYKENHTQSLENDVSEKAEEKEVRAYAPRSRKAPESREDKEWKTVKGNSLGEKKKIGRPKKTV